ncbi:MAG: glutathione S-transferase family protein, partial [Caulobacteraceae bacterium]
MTLTLHMHPLSSYCHKVLIALYELDVPFEAAFLNLGDEAERAAFFALWPVGKMPVLEDKAAGVVLPESSVIIDYLNRRFGGDLIPADPEAALEVRLQDRFFDLYVHTPMGVFTW